MAITSITIENFKGIGDAVTIPIRPITLLFGKNSAGKSTVLQALHYMREVCEHAGADPDRTHMGGDYIDLGGFLSLVHLHELDRKIRIRIEFDLTPEDSKSLNFHLKHMTNPDSAWIEVVTSWDGIVYTESYGYGLNGAEWIRLTPTDRTDAIPSDTVGSNGTKWSHLKKDMHLNIKHPFVQSEKMDDIKSVRKILEQALLSLVQIALNELREIRYLGPMRKIPPRDYRPQQTPFESLWAEGLEAWNTLGRDPQLVKKINRYMRDVLKLGYSISRQETTLLDMDGEIMKNLKKICNSEDSNVEELKKRVCDPLEQLRRHIRMKLHDEKNNIDLDSADVGLGIPQVIPVLVGALHSGPADPKRFYFSEPPRGFFAVEQPELHLHPAAQVALGDVFIDCIKYNRDHPIRVALERIIDFIENSDTDLAAFKEFIESMRENCGHPDIQEKANRIIANLKSSNDSDIQEAFFRFIESIRENRDHPDIQVAIEEYMKKIQNRNSDIQVAFEEFSNSRKNSSYRTLLIETHSEHLILRLLRRVRETNVRNSKKYEWRQSSMSPLHREMSEEAIRDAENQDSKDHQLTPDDLSVIYVQPTPEGVKFTPLAVTDDGDFDAPWPEGFFDERVEELL